MRWGFFFGLLDEDMADEEASRIIVVVVFFDFTIHIDWELHTEVAYLLRFRLGDISEVVSIFGIYRNSVRVELVFGFGLDVALALANIVPDALAVIDTCNFVAQIGNIDGGVGAIRFYFRQRSAVGII